MGIVFLATGPLISIFNSEQSAELARYADDGIRLYFLGYLVAGINIVLVAYFLLWTSPDPQSRVPCSAGLWRLSFCYSAFRFIWHDRHLAFLPMCRGTDICSGTRTVAGEVTAYARIAACEESTSILIALREVAVCV